MPEPLLNAASVKPQEPDATANFAPSQAPTQPHDYILNMIDEARAEQGITQVELARRADLKVSTVHRLLGGGLSNPTVETIARLVAALDCRLVIEPVGSGTPGPDTTP